MVERGGAWQGVMYQRLIKYERSRIVIESSSFRWKVAVLKRLKQISFRFSFPPPLRASPLPITRGRNSLAFLKISSRWSGTIDVRGMLER